MAIIPQVITEDSASGAQVIDGSLKFQGPLKTLLSRDFGAGNQKTYTISFWAKPSNHDEHHGSVGTGGGQVFSAGTVGGGARATFGFSGVTNGTNKDGFQIGHNATGSSWASLNSDSRFRDFSGWQHFVVKVDVTETTASDRVKLYANGVEQPLTGTYPNDEDQPVNNNGIGHAIGRYNPEGTDYFDGYLSNFYFIDGQALSPSEFGYTDPLTNTWRPKKYTGDYNISAGGDSIVSGATLLTWDDSPIGSVYTLSNSDKTATTNDGGTGYANADVWSIAIPANTTYAWTLDITNGDSTGGWYFTDSQTASGTHADERGGNSCGLRGGETSMGTHGTFATANGTSSGQSQISVNSAVSPNGTKKIDFVVYRPSSGDGKVWIRGYGADSWLGGGDPTNTSSTATFAIPDGTTYFGMTAYSRGSAQVLTFDELVTGATGVNSFYLPLDGSGPIGRDESENANDWTPVNFGGSTVIPKATGAFPILNTVNGGKVATPAIRGQAGIAVTVFGMKYYLDGVETPSLDQYRGQTVTFDLSDSTCASHPLRLSTTSDGTHGGGSEYSEGKQEGGTPGSVGAATTITYPHNAPDTLYYYCGTHSGMGGTGSVGLSSDVQKADPYAWRNVLALPLIGNATDVGIACTLTPKTMTAVGNAAASSDTGNFYGGSFEFDGSGDGLTCPDNTDFEFGSGDFTVECWVKQDDTSGFDVYVGKYGGSSDGEFLIGKNTNTPCFYWQDSSGNANINATNFTGNTDDWYHMACVREGDVFTMYINGVCEASETDATTIKTTSNKLTIGIENDESSSAFDGYIQDVLIYKGVAKYTGSTIGTQYFIPASTNPDIFPDTPSGVAYRSDLTKVTDGSVYFDGTGDYLNIADSADFDMGTGDFTLECWVNSIDDSDYQGVFGSNDYDDDMVLLQINNAGLLRFTNPSTIDQTGTTDLQNSGWHHIVMCRSGTTLKGFVDGSEEISVTYSSSIDWGHGDNSILIGTVDSTDYPGQYQYKGYISNLRLVKGTALYTQNFTPSPGPLAAVTNTKLLCCQSNTSAVTAAVVPDAGTGTAKLNAPLSSTPFADSSSTGATITNTGSIAAASAGTNNFDITNAASLDGSSQRLSTDNTDLYFNGKWTVDIWFKLDSSASGYNALINTGYPGSGSYLYFALDDDEKPYVEGGSAGGRTTATNAINKNQWYQMRVRADGSDIKQYINGELVVTHGVNTSDLSSAGTKTIGSLLDNGNNANNFHGLIGPVRYVRGDLGPPVAGGESTSSGAVSNTPDLPDIVAIGDAAPSNLNPFTNNIDTVMGQETSYCTWNPLDCYANPPTEGNLKGGVAGTSAWKHYRATTAMNSGKYYWEIYDKGGNFGGTSGSSGYVTGYALGSGGFTIEGQNINAGSAGLWGRQATGIYDNGIKNGTSHFPTAVAYDWYGFALDVDAGKMWTSTNGEWADGNPATGANPTWSDVTAGGFAMGGCYGSTIHVYANFGQKPFRAIPPEGFQPINDANLSSPEFVIPDRYVGIVTYTGNGNSPRSITGFNFQPDLVVYKERSEARDWQWYDSVRGVGPAKNLVSNTSYGQDSNDDTQYGYTSSFDKDGFTVTDGSSGGNENIYTNKSGETYVSYCWKAGGNKGTFNKDGAAYASASDAGLDGGTITPSGASVGTNQGFSIIKWNSGGSTGDFTLSHGLGNVPRFIIQKQLDSGNWWVYHADVIDDMAKYLQLNSTNAVATNSADMWGASAPTSSLFGVRVGDLIAASTDAITYLWADIPGMQKFGKYAGNQLADGPFVELGFRPALLMIKSSSAGSTNWRIIDDTRRPYNWGANDSTTEGGPWLKLNSYNDEANERPVDLLSNGFKVQGSWGGDLNYDSGTPTYIYAAWAHQPMNNFYGAQSNAR